MSVVPEWASRRPMRAQCSSTRTVVVPAATTRRPSRSASIDLQGGFFRQRISFRMKTDLRDLGHPHRLKRSQPHMKRQAGDEHTAGTDPLQDLRGEMQPGGGRGDRAALLAQRQSGNARGPFPDPDRRMYGGRGTCPSSSSRAKKSSTGVKRSRRSPNSPVASDSGLEESLPSGVREGQLLAHRHPARRAGQRSPFPVADLLREQHFHLSCRLSLAHAKQPCRNNAAVVQHQHIAFAEQLRQLVKPRVLPCAGLPAQGQHAAAPRVRLGVAARLALGEARSRNRRPAQVRLYESDNPVPGAVSSKEEGRYGDHDACSR